MTLQLPATAMADASLQRLLAVAGANVPPPTYESEPIDAAEGGHPLTWDSTLYSGYLCLLSDSLDGLEELRIATDNRVRQLTRSTADVDGEMRGLGLDARSPEVARALQLADGLLTLERSVIAELQRQAKAHPLSDWITRKKGIGFKQAARLLAVIGDPYWNDLYERPRTVSELWAYCGYRVDDGVAQRRNKGQLANWSSKAKSRVYLMSQSCIKSRDGEYRAVYDQGRALYADALHPRECRRCGPAGKPALVGSPLSLGHQHARALRLVSKEILKDLWLEARQFHIERGDIVDE